MASKQSRAGPHEEQRYRYKIPSRDEILAALKTASVPLEIKALGAKFDIKSAQHLRALENRLRAMVRDGEIIRNRAGNFCLIQELDLVTGRVKAHRDGYGFLIPDDGSDDLYLSAREMRTIWEGDRVAARAREDRRDRREGHVVEILARAKSFVVGQFRRERGINYVLEHGDERTEVLIGRADAHGAKPGDIVRVEIIDYPTERSHAIGRVLECLGRFDAPGVETAIALEAHGIPNEWPEAVIEATAAFSEHVPAQAKHGRVDLRKLPFVTIDGADAKDFDDAVYCEPLGEGWRLLVAIADVSHYVQPDEPLDAEAKARGTSVYFPDRVVPMLPEALSNGLCSLNPHVDRLCVVCEMRVSPRGRVTASKFYDAVMRSAARLTYESANRLLNEKPRRAKDRELRSILDPLHAVYRAFDRARSRRGAINFDPGETFISLDESGAVRAIEPRARLVTHKIIEECMIAANAEAAKRLRKTKLPSLFRVHEKPESTRLEELGLFLRTFGIKLPPESKLMPRFFSKVLKDFAGKPESELIETVLLRSMNKAQYQPQNVGHFGLALDAYAHFTSPIRRYPDLLVHRAIKWSNIHRSPKGFPHSSAEMARLGESCSAAERRADTAVWDVEEQLKCQFMHNRIGEVFEVVVAGIVAFGLFVRVQELGIDGLVHVSALPPDYYHRDPSGTELTGERGKRIYRLADTLTVRLANVNLEERKVDFVPVEERDREARPRRRVRRRAR